ncbi:hypothetical protein BsWGS_09641 [Bradybaena similaris]
MPDERLHLVIVASNSGILKKDASKAKIQNEPNPPDELFQSSVDDPSFLAKQKKRLAGTHTVNKIQFAKKESPTRFSLIRTIFITFATSTCFTFLLTMLMFIPISKIIIGAIFFDECPAEPFIPIYLVVGGTVACIRDIINMCVRATLTDEKYYKYDVPITLLAFIYTMAEFGWFVYGSVYVFLLVDKFQWKDKSAKDYCSYMLYLYAFVLTAMSYFLLFMTCIISGATICAAQCLDDAESRAGNPTTVVIVHPHDHESQQSLQQPQQQEHWQHQQPQQRASRSESTTSGGYGSKQS